MSIDPHVTPRGGTVYRGPERRRGNDNYRGPDRRRTDRISSYPEKTPAEPQPLKPVALALAAALALALGGLVTWLVLVR